MYLMLVNIVFVISEFKKGNLLDRRINKCENSRRSKLNDAIINLNGNSESEWEANSPTGNESQNGEADREAIKNENQDRGLANNITEMLERSEPPLSPEGGEKTPTTIKEMKLTTPSKQYH
jgi:hypothetical protein